MTNRPAATSKACTTRPRRWRAPLPPGSTQAGQRTLAASIRTLEVADEIRRQLGVVFPGEAARSGRTARH